MFEDNQISPVALAKGDKPGDQGPEDIFSQTVPVEQNEPSLKAAPSPFVKKNEGQEIMSSQMPAMPGVLPAMPKIGLNKKNLIIFIFIIILDA